MRANVDIHELKQVIVQILDYITTDLAVDRVEITKDYYRQISPDALYALERDLTSTDIETGQLIDDWEFLLPLLDSENQSVPLMLEHVAPILLYLAHAVDEKDNADS